METISGNTLKSMNPSANTLLFGENNLVYRYYNNQWQYLKTIDTTKPCPEQLWSLVDNSEMYPWRTTGEELCIYRLEKLYIGDINNLYYSIILGKDNQNFKLWSKDNNYEWQNWDQTLKKWQNNNVTDIIYNFNDINVIEPYFDEDFDRLDDLNKIENLDNTRVKSVIDYVLNTDDSDNDNDDNDNDNDNDNDDNDNDNE